MPNRDEIVRFSGISATFAAALEAMRGAEHQGELTLALIDAILQAAVDSGVVLRCHDCGSQHIDRTLALAELPVAK